MGLYQRPEDSPHHSGESFWLFKDLNQLAEHVFMAFNFFFIAENTEIVLAHSLIHQLRQLADVSRLNAEDVLPFLLPLGLGQATDVLLRGPLRLHRRRQRHIQPSDRTDNIFEHFPLAGIIPLQKRRHFIIDGQRFRQVRIAVGKENQITVALKPP